MAVNLINSNDINITQTGNDITLGLTGKTGDLVVDSIKSKNLFSGFLSGAYNSTTGVFDTSTSGIATPKINIENGTTYYLSGMQSGIVIRVLFWNNGTFVSSTTMTPTSDGIAITMAGNQFAFQTANTNQYSNVQLEKGNTKTDYKPFENLDGQELYSGIETRIGTWIDGKPLYRKTLLFPNGNSGSTAIVNYTLSDYGISNVSTIFIVHPSYYSNSISGATYPFQYNDGSAFECNTTQTKLNVKLGYQAISNSPFVITLEYTKTTD